MMTGKCPKCAAIINFDLCEYMPKSMPLCDACEIIQAKTWAKGEKIRIWENLYKMQMPKSYASSDPERIKPQFVTALDWTARKHHGGLGLIGKTGSGKSCAVSCLVFALGQSFLWWSGTEARDAAIEAATADKDREGANRRWQRAMSVPVLVLDDISQGRMTEAWSSKLFDLLETRRGDNLPTFWTSQINLGDIRAKIIKQNGGDSAQADAIARRLAQHSLILTHE